MTTSRSARVRLTHRQIVETAVAELAAGGIDGFSMRGLARRLDVAPMTVYGYFADQASLFNAVVDHLATELRPPSPDAPWRERLADLFGQLHEFLVRYPFMVQIRLRQPMHSPGALHFEEVAFEILQSAGFPPEETAWAYRTLFVYSFGQASFSVPAGELEQERRDALAALVRLPPAEYPAVLAGAGSILDSLDGDALFEYGLTLILDALEARLG